MPDKYLGEAGEGATAQQMGLMTAQQAAKLEGIAAGAQVNPTDDYIRTVAVLPANSLNADASITSYPTGLSIILAGAVTTGWPPGPNTSGTVQTFKSAGTRATQYYVFGGITAVTWVRSWTGNLDGAWGPWSNVSANAPFMLHHSNATQNTALGGTLPSKVWFATEVYDYDNRVTPGTNMTNATHSRYTSRFAGVVRFGGAVGFNAPATLPNPVHYAKLYLRHTVVATSTVTDYLIGERSFRMAAERVRVDGSRPLLLAAGDTVELHATQDLGTSVALLADRDYTYFFGDVVGL